MDAGPRFDKTYSRVPDRYPLPDDADAAPGSSRFTKTYQGAVWRVNHKLLAKTLLLDFWIDKTVNPNPHYVSVVQEDLNNITITWDSVAAGRVCIYRCLERDVFTRSFAQEIPATTWTFTHDLGTEAVLADCWVDGQLQDSSCISISETEVTCTFDDECTGIVCLLLADPDVNPQFLVYWNGILGKPNVFPPAQHVHEDMMDIPMAYDSKMLGGLVAAEYLTTNAVGENVCPLDADGFVPLTHMPDAGKLRTTAKSGTYNLVAWELQVDNVNSPLYFEQDGLSKRTILRQRPVFKNIVLDGTVVSSLSNQEKIIEASAEFDCKVIIGDNLSATILDKHTFRLDAPSVGARVFKYVGILANDEEWQIRHAVFNNAGTQIIQLHESIEQGAEYTKLTNHIINQDNVLVPFFGIGITPATDVLDIEGSVLKSKLRFDADHLWWEEQVSSNVVFSSWSTICGCFWNNYLNTFIIVDFLNGDYRWHSFNTNTEDIVFLRAVPMDELPNAIDMRDNFIYTIVNDNGNIKLQKTSFFNLPVISWTDVCVLTASTFPVDGSSFGIIMQYTGRYLLIYDIVPHILTVWDTQTPNADYMYSITLAVPLTSFIVWPDMYVSYCYANFGLAGQTGFYTSDKPLTDSTAIFKHSAVELLSGDCEFIAMDSTPPNLLGFGIRKDGRYVIANKVQQGNLKVYKTFNINLMTRDSFGIPIRYSVERGYGFTPLSLSIPDGISIKIAFTTIPSSVQPTELAVWTGTEFKYYPISEFPVRAQNLSILNLISLSGGETLYYYLFIVQQNQYAYFEFDQNFTYTESEKSGKAPLAMNIPNTPTMQVTIHSGSIKIMNKMGRDVLDLNLVVYNA